MADENLEKNTIVDIDENETTSTILSLANAETAEEQQSIMDNIMDALGDTSSAAGLEEFAALLAMPDEQFDTFSELILAEVQKSLNDPQDRILLLESMRKEGLTVSDLTELQTKLFEEIDNNIGGMLSKKKLDFLKRTMSLIIDSLTDAFGVAGTIVNIPIELSENAIKPKYAHDGDGAMDLYALDDYTIDPGETVLIKTGLKVAIPMGYGLLIQPRSGQSLKTKLRIANTPGLIDSGYRDEIGIIVENIEPKIKDIGVDTLGNGTTLVLKSIEYGKSYVIEKGQRVAQARLVEIPTINWLEVDDIGQIEGDRGGGFGSSGKF